jgi:hypothetical protein
MSLECSLGPLVALTDELLTLDVHLYPAASLAAKVLLAASGVLLGGLGLLAFAGFKQAPRVDDDRRGVYRR